MPAYSNTCYLYVLLKSSDDPYCLPFDNASLCHIDLTGTDIIYRLPAQYQTHGTTAQEKLPRLLEHRMSLLKKDAADQLSSRKK